MVVEVQEFQSYLVKMDGTGRVTKRNQRFLKPIRTYRELLAGVTPEAERPTSSRVATPTAAAAARSGCATTTAAAAEMPANSSGGTSSRLGGWRPTGLVGEEVESMPEGNPGTALPAEQDSGEQTSTKTTSLEGGPGTILVDVVDKPVSVAMGRGRRAVKVPQKLVVGDPDDPRFNRKRK